MDKRPMTAGQMRAAAGVPEAYPAEGNPPHPVATRIRKPFDPDSEPIFDARCGRKLEPIGHGFALFMLCPVHGEFTIAPMVIKLDTGWVIEHRDAQAEGMWETCRAIDRGHV